MPGFIDFDAEALIGKLSIIEKTQISYAGKQALKRLGYELKQDVSKYMEATFRDPVPFTLASPKYEANGLQVAISISKKGDKGQDPARYLYPVSTDDTTGRKPVYITRFTKALRKRGIVDATYFAIPWLEGRGVPVNSYGNVPNNFYRSVLGGFQRGGAPGKRNSLQAGFRVFSIPDLSKAKSTRFNPLSNKPGIYRAKGRQLEFLFGYAKEHPTVGTIFDFDGFVRRRSAEIFPTLLRQELDKAMR